MLLKTHIVNSITKPHALVAHASPQTVGLYAPVASKLADRIAETQPDREQARGG